MSYKLERDCSRAIMAYLKNTSGRFFKVVQGRYSEAGISDIIGVYKGCFCAIEVKSSKGTASKKQIIFQRQIKAAGGYAIIAKTVNEVKQMILEIDHAKNSISLSKAKLVGSPDSTR